MTKNQPPPEPVYQESPTLRTNPKTLVPEPARTTTQPTPPTDHPLQPENPTNGTGPAQQVDAGVSAMSVMHACFASCLREAAMLRTAEDAVTAQPQNQIKHANV